MKPFLAILIVLAVLAAGLWLMAPKDQGAAGAGAKGSAGVKPNDDKIATISKGERVEIEQHLVAGRFTVVEFTADW